MNLARLEVFVTVCATRSFTRAADQLAITKSAASQQVATLERELGVQLLHRSTRNLAPTDAGAALLEEGQALLDQAQRLAERTMRQAAQLSGVLRVTSSEDTAVAVAAVIADYLRLHPGMQVEYRPSDRLLDLVADGLDLSLRATTRRDSSLRAVTLAEYDVWCVASPQYLRERGTPRRLAELASHAWIAFTLIPHPWTLQTRDGKQSVRFQRTVSTSSSAGGRALALAGAGLFAGPRFIVEAEVDAGRLVRILPTLKLPVVTLYAAWPGRGEPPTKTREFIELAKARLGRGPKPAPQ
ncbi:LysR family transcriptional regulator [Ramlibacter pallidus]|uniref:LysR family transcriptional regulator n=1 Tax=Ramlibacter pallidus TaxID=2780087 RepID=A0ABR9S7J2_9BURK|nr:LysR family transcriptional regulator [Ramlibacter pallidus]MBE7368972.1 LysR family transcriptional regulator [Ramlibacter pallidus]